MPVLPADSGDQCQTAMERLQGFIESHKKAVIVAGSIAVAAAAVGVVYYASSSGSAGGDLESGKRKKKKTKKRKNGAGTKGDDSDGPILQDKQKADGTVDIPNEPKLTAAEIEALSLEDRVERAAALKAKGNESYQVKKFALAAEYYSRAIEMTPRPESVFFSNRAACFLNMNPPKYELVIADCDEALKLDKTYIKALNRRAGALESLKRYKEALIDYTTSTILEKFQNPTSAQSVERILKIMATEEATKILASRGMRLPSKSFTTAYFIAFRKRPLPTLPASPTQADQQLLLACEALEAQDYVHSMTLVNECLEGHEPSWDAGRAEAYNLRGSYRFLCGDSLGAKADLSKSTSILPTLTQSWVKIASVHMEQGDPTAAFAAFDTAIAHSPNDADIFYHRGQVYFIMGEWQKAIDDYEKSTKLDEQFVFSLIQLGVAQYKAGKTRDSMITFRKTMRLFPQQSESFNYYGEVLLDQSKWKDAIEKFDLAIEIEMKKTADINVLPLVNKGLAVFQAERDGTKAIKLCKEAYEIDPDSEAAIATLAQLNLQLGNMEESVKWFDMHATMARSEAELQHALNFKFASEAQAIFLQNHPDMRSQMGPLAQSLMMSGE